MPSFAKDATVRKIFGEFNFEVQLVKQKTFGVCYVWQHEVAMRLTIIGARVGFAQKMGNGYETKAED